MTVTAPAATAVETRHPPHRQIRNLIHSQTRNLILNRYRTRNLPLNRNLGLIQHHRPRHRQTVAGRTGISLSGLALA